MPAAQANPSSCPSMTDCSLELCFGWAIPSSPGLEKVLHFLLAWACHGSIRKLGFYILTTIGHLLSVKHGEQPVCVFGRKPSASNPFAWSPVSRKEPRPSSEWRGMTWDMALRDLLRRAGAEDSTSCHALWDTFSLSCGRKLSQDAARLRRDMGDAEMLLMTLIFCCAELFVVLSRLGGAGYLASTLA